MGSRKGKPVQGAPQLRSYIHIHTQMQIQQKHKPTSQQENTITNTLQIIPNYNKKLGKYNN